MIEVNDKELQIEVKETLTWNYVEEFHYNSIKNMLDEEGMQSILDYELSTTDKKQILHYILNEFEDEEAKASYYDNYNVSVFDEEVIRKGIVLWLEEKFDVDVFDIVIP